MTWNLQALSRKVPNSLDYSQGSHILYKGQPHTCGPAWGYILHHQKRHTHIKLSHTIKYNRSCAATKRAHPAVQELPLC